MICRFPVFSRNNIDYDLLIYLSECFIKRIEGKMGYGTTFNRKSVYTIGVNRVGTDGNGIPFNGHTKFLMVLESIVSTPENIEEILQIEISLDDLKLKEDK